MSGIFLLLFLFAFSLVVPLSIDDANCPEIQACLQMNFCDEQIHSISYLKSKVKTDIGCSSSSTKATWTVFRFEPKFEREWLIEIYSTRSTKEFTVSFDNKLLYVTNRAASDVSGILEPGQDFQTKKYHCEESENITFVTFKLSSAKSIYDQLLNDDIQTGFRAGLVLEAEENKKFKKKVLELLNPCYNSRIIIDSDLCDHRKLKEFCAGDSCTLQMGYNTATCPTKLWIDTGSAFIRKWLSIDRIFCENGLWKWKEYNGTEWKSIGDNEISCAATVPDEVTKFLYATIGGSIGLVIILIVIVFLWKRRCRSRSNGPLSTVKTNTSSDLGSIPFGAVVAIKAEAETWNWPEETDAIASIPMENITLSSAPQPEPSSDAPNNRAIPGTNVTESPKNSSRKSRHSKKITRKEAPKKVRDTQFINVTETTTQNSSRETRRHQKSTRKAPKKSTRDTQFINVTESPTRKSSKEIRHQKKSARKEWMTESSTKNSTRKGANKPARDTQFINVTESPTRHSSREIGRQKKVKR